MKDIKFSIIIPAYNSEKYIKECLDSIFMQTYKNIEIIVVNDCSTDNTLKLLEEMQDRIIILSTNENKKQGAARNLGLEKATGDYILFVDADDKLFFSDVIESIAKKISETNQPDLIYLGMKITGRREIEIIPCKENCTKKYRLAENPFINVVSICWKRELIEKNKIRFPEQMRYEDVYFTFLGIEKAKTFEYIDKIYYLYNNRDDSTTTNYSLNQVTDTLKIIEKLFELYDYIDEKNIKYLDERILQQKERLKVRLDRAIKKEIEKRAN